MASHHLSGDTEGYYLPQRGFGPLQEYSKLLSRHKLLFRVYTPRSLQSSALSDTDPYFVAPRFDSTYTSASEALPTLAMSALPLRPTYLDVCSHLDWSTRSRSPLVSASFSFTWAIWEAYHRYHSRIKHDLEIAVIDAEAVSACAVTAAEILSECPPDRRHRNHWKWYHSIQESQTVLIYQYITKSSVLASIPLVPLLNSLPAYFHTEPRGPAEGTRISWIDNMPNSTYPRFCSELTTRFLRLENSARIHAATIGSVRLACSFLRPWISNQIVDREVQLATLTSFAKQIAHWPAHFWTVEHTEIERIIVDTSSLFIDHLCTGIKERGHLEATIKDLEGLLNGYSQELAQMADRVSDGQNEEHGLASAWLEQLTPSTVCASDYLDVKSLSHDASPGADVESSIDKNMEQAIENGFFLGPATSLLEVPSCASCPCLQDSDSQEHGKSASSRPSVLEQASFATVFFLFSTLTTLFIARSSSQPLIPNVT